MASSTCFSNHTSCFLVAILVNYVVATTAAEISVTRLEGQINGISRLRCTISKSNPMSWIYWVKGSSDKLLYYDSKQTEKKDGRRGNFKTRNVTGFFANNYTSHDIIIFSSELHDEGWYTCQVRIEPLESYTGSINLLLVATPEAPPSISGPNGVTFMGCATPYPTWNAQTMNIRIPFSCKVDACSPNPIVDWQYFGQTNITEQEGNFTIFQKYGKVVTAISKQLNIIPVDNITIICKVWTPDSRSGNLHLQLICLRLLVPVKLWSDTKKHCGSGLPMPVTATLVALIVSLLAAILVLILLSVKLRDTRKNEYAMAERAHIGTVRNEECAEHENG